MKMSKKKLSLTLAVSILVLSPFGLLVRQPSVLADCPRFVPDALCPSNKPISGQRLLGDNPDDLAHLVESLRYSFGHYGDWVSLPAPLFFERVVRDYISDFHIDDNETEDNSEEEKPQYIQPSLFD